jgi:ABC-type spermidine/putrescine transport system permease subunit I
VSTLTFALAWLRVSDLAASVEVVFDSLYLGIIILIISIVFGFPVA